MRLRLLQIHGPFGLIETRFNGDSIIEPHPASFFSCITGDNGAGKTLLLETLAKCFEQLANNELAEFEGDFWYELSIPNPRTIHLQFKKGKTFVQRFNRIFNPAQWLEASSEFLMTCEASEDAKVEISDANRPELLNEILPQIYIRTSNRLVRTVWEKNKLRLSSKMGDKVDQEEAALTATLTSTEWALIRTYLRISFDQGTVIKPPPEFFSDGENLTIRRLGLPCLALRLALNTHPGIAHFGTDVLIATDEPDSGLSAARLFGVAAFLRKTVEGFRSHVLISTKRGRVLTDFLPTELLIAHRWQNKFTFTEPQQNTYAAMPSVGDELIESCLGDNRVEGYSSGVIRSILETLSLILTTNATGQNFKLETLHNFICKTESESVRFLEEKLHPKESSYQPILLSPSLQAGIGFIYCQALKLGVDQLDLNFTINTLQAMLEFVGEGYWSFEIRRRLRLFREKAKI